MIYLNNAATTLQKPGAVIEAVNNCLTEGCANAGRSAYKSALSAARTVFETREAVAAMFGAPDPLRVIYTSGATEALNLAIKGTPQKGDHVIATSMEHNSVLRPLTEAEKDGVETTIVECSKEGLTKAPDIEKAIKQNTKLVICTHASNVTGAIMPIAEIGELCRKRDLLFLVDASQSAGFLDININEMNIDMLAVPGHKSLMGIQGIGMLILSDRANPTELMQGGTGSEASSIIQPETLPDKYESGTLNLPGIVSINAAIKFIDGVGLNKIRAHKRSLTKAFLDSVTDVNGINIHSPISPELTTAIVAMTLNKISSSEFAAILDEKYNICVRAGLHCAPLAHKTIGTYETAVVRFSFGYFNTEEDVKKAIQAVCEISQR